MIFFFHVQRENANPIVCFDLLCGLRVQYNTRGGFCKTACFAPSPSEGFQRAAIGWVLALCHPGGTEQEEERKERILQACRCQATLYRSMLLPPDPNMRNQLDTHLLSEGLSLWGRGWRESERKKNGGGRWTRMPAQPVRCKKRSGPMWPAANT